MVPGLAFAVVALATVFAQTMLVRYTANRRPHQLAWTLALALFTLASTALVVGVTTGWDRATFRVFFLLGAVLSVPWLALGTVFLLLGPRAGTRAAWALVFFSGLAAGIIASAPMATVAGTAIPVGKDVFGTAPRVLAALGSGLGATVIVAGALVSAARLARGHQRRRLAVANLCIALGTLTLSSGGLVQGALGDDEAFTVTLTIGLAVIYAGFLLAERGAERPAERAAAVSSANLHSPLS